MNYRLPVFIVDIMFMFNVLCADLKATHFQQHHKYTLEWQPGPEGYLYWCGLQMSLTHCMISSILMWLR